MEDKNTFNSTTILKKLFFSRIKIDNLLFYKIVRFFRKGQEKYLPVDKKYFDLFDFICH